MFVYLDESGDTGFKFRQGSTRFFVITLLIVEDPIPIHAAIDELRRRFGFDHRTEFKFNHSSAQVKRAFFEELRKHDFAVQALVIDKTTVPRQSMKQQESFYDFVIRSVLANNREAIQDAMLVLDQSIKSRKRQDQLATYLRRALNTDPHASRIRGIVHHESHRDNLIQAADMVSGAIYARYHRNNDVYFKFIAEKVVPPQGELLMW